MKRLLVILVIGMIATSVMAAPKPEGPVSIKVLSAESEANIAFVMDQFRAEYPDVKVEWIQEDLSDGSTKTAQAMIDSGDPFDVYFGYMGRVSQYIDPKFSLNLEDYHTDLNDYFPEILDGVKRDGKVYGLAGPVGAQGFVINNEMWDALNIPADIKKADLTIDNFLGLGRAVRDKWAGKKWVTGMFAKNQSGDYLIFNWFAAFGAEKFKSGDYSKTTLNSPAGVATMKFLKQLYTEGLIQEESFILSDDDYAQYWAQSSYLGTAWFPAWSDYYFKTFLEQGVIDHTFETEYVRFPKGPGVTKVPTCTSYTGIVGRETGDKAKNTVIARMMFYMNNGPSQTVRVIKDKNYATRKSVTTKLTDVYWQQVDKIIQDNGLYDLGLSDSKFAEVRMEMFPRLQNLFRGKESPEEAMAIYEKRVNAILADR